MATGEATLARARDGRFQTFRALRHRNFRLYWFGMLVAIIGWQVQMVAQGWLVYELTGSTALLGAVGLTQAIPTIVLTLAGGVVADRVDRRRLLIITQGSVGLLLALLAALVLSRTVQLWHIFAIAFAVGGVWAFDQPARQALVPHLVEREDLMNAIAMVSMVWQSSRIIGPAIAGPMIAWLGVGPCFLVTTIGMLGMITSLRTLQVTPIVPTGRHNALADLRDGLGYVIRTPIFSMLIGLTFFNSLFGMSYVQMMPVFAKDVLAVGSRGLGLLLAVGGAGALIGTTILATLGIIRRKGLIVLGGSAVFGVLLIGFALSRSYALSLALLFVIGAVNSVYMTTVNTSLQALVPDELRGRVMGIFTLTWSFLPLGGFLAGAVAGQFAHPATGASLAIAAGGVAVILAALAAALSARQIRGL
ncbi:MAG: MFS transporter [Dehalococcoidia bacterium]